MTLWRIQFPVILRIKIGGKFLDSLSLSKTILILFFIDMLWHENDLYLMNEYGQKNIQNKQKNNQPTKKLHFSAVKNIAEEVNVALHTESRFELKQENCTNKTTIKEKKSKESTFTSTKSNFSWRLPNLIVSS